MNLENFNYQLPPELIAQYPLENREDSKLLVIDKNNGEISHDCFKNIAQYLPEDSQIVLNNSQVFPARLLGQKRNRSSG